MVVKGIRERLQEWRAAENEAVEMERAVAKVGQAAADPRVYELLITAKLRRERADRLFGAIVRACKTVDERPK